MANSSWFNTSNQYIKYRIEVTQNSQNIANNTSNVTVKVWIYRTNTGYTTYGSGTCYCKINGTTYSASITSSQKITNSGIYLFSKTLDIGHNSDGSKSLTCSAWFSHDRFSSSEQSASFGLTTIPRKSTISSITGGTIGGSMTVNIDRKSSSFTTTVWVQLGGSGWVTVATKSTATAITFTVPTSLANQIPNATSGNGQVIIRTYDANGNNLGDSSTGKQFLVPDYSPTINSWSYSEEGTGLGVYVQGKSKVKCSCSCGTSYGASITSYTWNINGTNYSGASATTGYINGSGNKTLTLTIKDSRGKTASRSASINFIQYSPPICSLSAYRCNSDGTYNSDGEYVKCSFNTDYYTVDGKNTVGIKLQSRELSVDTWTDRASYSTVQKNVSLILEGFNTEKRYRIRLTIGDKWSSTSTEVDIATAFVLVDFKNGGKGISFGKVSEADIFEVNMPSAFRRHYNGKYCITSSSTTGNSGKWTKIAVINLPNTWQVCAGDLHFVSAENYAGTGTLSFVLRNGSTVGSLATAKLYWNLGSYGGYRDTAKIIKVSDTSYDIYVQNFLDYTTYYIELGICHNPDLITLVSHAGWVAESTLGEVVTTSYFESQGSRNKSGAWWNNGAVTIGSDGVSEVGKYLDFHASSGHTGDYDGRLFCDGSKFVFNKDVRPASNNGASLGGSDARWSYAFLVNNPNVSSDRTLKENIQYLRNNNVSKDDTMTYSDMYNFVRDDLELAKYNFKGQDTEEINFIAQDLLYNVDGTDNKVGQFIVKPVAPNTEEEILEIKNSLEEGQEYHDPTLSYDTGNYVSVLAGALKSAINEIEMLKQEVASLKQIIDINKY